MEDVDAFAQDREWPMADVIERDRAAGTDGRVTWRAGDGVALVYVEDALFGIGCYTFDGDPGELAALADKALEPWSVGELCAQLDEAPDAKARGQRVLRLGLAAPVRHDAEVFARIAATLNDTDPRVRYAALYAASFTGYGEFAPLVRKMAQNDPEQFIRDRAARH